MASNTKERKISQYGCFLTIKQTPQTNTQALHSRQIQSRKPSPSPSPTPSPPPDHSPNLQHHILHDLILPTRATPFPCCKQAIMPSQATNDAYTYFGLEQEVVPSGPVDTSATPSTISPAYRKSKSGGGTAYVYVGRVVSAKYGDNGKHVKVTPRHGEGAGTKIRAWQQSVTWIPRKQGPLQHSVVA